MLLWPLGLSSQFVLLMLNLLDEFKTANSSLAFFFHLKQTKKKPQHWINDENTMTNVCNALIK